MRASYCDKKNLRETLANSSLLFVSWQVGVFILLIMSPKRRKLETGTLCVYDCVMWKTYCKWYGKALADWSGISFKVTVVCLKY